jgi:dihydroxyacetone kinase phosphoprotein-dependent L subunit
VRVTLERAVGAENARAVRVFAGDIVPRKKPAPDIYLLALDSLGLPADRVVVIEDSRNGLLAAAGAGVTCMITVNDFTEAEDFGEAALVVSSLGDPGGECTAVLANHSRATPGDWITLADLTCLLPSTRGAPMGTADLADVEAIVRVIATTAVGNEKYFGDLDAVVGDGDFGYSMARGFELVLAGWDDFDRADIGTFLKKVAIVITSRIGGTSGPIWGTAFLRAGSTAGSADRLEPAQIVAMLRASIEGIKARGKSDVGDKTLLDALVPAVSTIEEQISAGHDSAAIVRAAAATAREHAEATRPMQAMRGRASYTGERSIGTLDAGAIAVALMFETLADQWPKRLAPS